MSIADADGGCKERFVWRREPLAITRRGGQLPKIAASNIRLVLVEIDKLAIIWRCAAFDAQYWKLAAGLQLDRSSQRVWISS